MFANSKLQCNFVNEIKIHSKMDHSINERNIGNGFI